MLNHTPYSRHSGLHVLLFFYMIKWSSAELFLVSPGDGEDYYYSPAGINATLNCTVNNTNLQWSIDRRTYDVFGTELSSRGIFLSPTTASGHTRVSYIRVLGKRNLNNNTKVCCQSTVQGSSREACTTLVIYDLPSPPEEISFQYVGNSGQINISWTVATLRGVNENYILVFDDHTIIATVVPYYVYTQNISDSKILCVMFIKAVNGAGESDPSDSVTIPSLPDIGPVTASLTHQVWKTGEDIMVNVSFEPALFCEEYPVILYVLKLRLLKTGTVVEKCVGPNETDIALGPHDGLTDNQKYEYTVTAVNKIGNVTSKSGIINTYIADYVHSTSATIIISLSTLIVFVVIVIAVLSFSVILLKSQERQRTKHQDIDCVTVDGDQCPDFTSPKISMSSPTQVQVPFLQHPSATLLQENQNFSTPLSSSATHIHSHTSANCLKVTTNIDTYPNTTPSLGMALYAIPEKLKMKNDTNHHEFEKEKSAIQQSDVKTENNSGHNESETENSASLQSSIKTEENNFLTPESSGLLYNNGVNSPVSCAEDLKSPLKLGSAKSSVLCQHSDNLKDITGCNCAEEYESTNVPVYAIPNKVQSNEPFYFILENIRAPCTAKYDPLDATSDITPVLKSISPVCVPPPSCIPRHN